MVMVPVLFFYTIAKKAYTEDNDWYYEKSLEIWYCIPTEEVERVCYSITQDDETSMWVIFMDKQSVSCDMYANGMNCDPPFEVTPDLFPYPSFLP